MTLETIGGLLKRLKSASTHHINLYSHYINLSCTFPFLPLILKFSLCSRSPKVLVDLLTILCFYVSQL